jgi:rhodanese-related sulfurtransferase
LIKEIVVEKLVELLAHGDAILIDVRQPAEHAAEYIEGAHLIPLALLTLESLPARNKTIVIHCQSGRRSAEACQRLLALEPSLDVYNLHGGILAWKQAGLKVHKFNPE